MAAKKKARGGKSNKLPFHDIVDMFPPMSHDELKALDADIAKHGVSQPILVWKGFIVDGRNRVTIADKHGKKCKVEKFVGTEEEMIEEVWRRNFTRRHLDSGQRAAAIADFERRIGDVRSKAGRPADGTAERMTTQELAQASGTNRTYVAQARAVGESDPKLLQKVIKGDVTLGEAVEQISEDKPKRKKKKRPPSEKPESSEEESEEEEEDEPDRIWKDALDNEIPEAVREFFDEDDLFDKMISLTKQIVEVSNLIADKPCGAMYDKSVVNVECGNIRQQAELRRPYTICPSCKGRKDGCAKCRKLGFLNKQAFGLLPKEERRKHGDKRA